MTTIERAEQMARSAAGHSYNPETLRAICNAGYSAIPDGGILGEAGGQTLRLVNNAVACIVNGTIIKTSPVSDDSTRERVLIMYAVMASRIGTRMS